MNYPHSDKLREPLTRHARAVPVISTSHVSASDGETILSEQALGFLATVSDGAGHLLSTDPAKWKDIHHEGVVWSINIQFLMRDFHALGYPWIILDRDGEVLSDMPTFEW